MSFNRILEKYEPIGKIHSEIKDELKIVNYVGLTGKEIANMIEEKIKLKVKENLLDIGNVNEGLGFPVGISVNNCCAHWTYSPFHCKKNDIIIGNDDLIKIDFGINNKGFIVDSAFSISTSNNDIHTKLMKASQEALDNAIKKMRPDVRLSDIGSETEEIAHSYDFNPVRDLCGHQILPFKIHGEKVVPNISMSLYGDKVKENEIYAIEPFISNKSGNIYSTTDSSHFCINYMIHKDKRTNMIREIPKDCQALYFLIEEKFKTLPFCDKWLECLCDIEKGITMELIWNKLNDLVNKRLINSYPPLYEIDKNAIVSQFEHTVAVLDTNTKILT